MQLTKPFFADNFEWILSSSLENWAHQKEERFWTSLRAGTPRLVSLADLKERDDQVFGQKIATIKAQIVGPAKNLEHIVFLKCSQPIKATKIGEV